MNKFFHKFYSAVYIAIKNLIVHKVRAFLTLLGIVIGIATVTVIVSAGEGLKGFVLGQVESFGSNTLFVEARPPELELIFTIITTLKAEQMEKIIESDAFPYINKGYAYAATQAVARSPYEEITVDVNGTNEDYIEIDAAKIARGRFITERENRSLKKVAVLGSEAAEKLFPTGDPLNQSIKVNTHSFKVIGVLEEKGADLYMNVDQMVFIPIRVLQKFYSGTDWIPYFAVQVDDARYLQESKEAVVDFLRKEHGIQRDSKEDFAVTTSEEAMEIVDSVLVGVSILLLCLALISLVVGGVGIMNIMYVTVTERTREVGLRKAVGAKYYDILMQFLLEAAIITGIGGVLGAALGMGLTYMMAVYAQDYGFQWEYFVSVDAIILAVIVALFCGVVFGLAPARKAAKQDPIEALRYE